MDRDRPPPSPPPEMMMPRPAAILLVIPLLAIFAVGLAYTYLFWSGLSGRPAQGSTVEMQFRGCPEAGPVVRARAEDMGLGDLAFDATADGFRLRAVLPADEGAAEQIPATLATPGVFAFKSDTDGDVIFDNAGIAQAGVRLDMTMTPATLVVTDLDAATIVAARMNAEPEGRMSFWIDGESVYSQSNRKPFSHAELEIPPSAANDKARMELAAQRGIILNNGPLPCDVQVVSVTDVSPAE